MLKQPLCVIELNLRELSLGHLGVQSCLVKSCDDLEQRIALLDRLAFFDLDRLEIPALHGPDLDVAVRVDLADILLRVDHILNQRAGDQDLVVLVVNLLLFLVTSGKEKAKYRQDDGEVR